MKRNFDKCPRRCKIDCYANMQGGKCYAPAIEEADQKPQLNVWVPISDYKLDEHIYYRIRLTDGSELNVWAQMDGDFWWKFRDCFFEPHQITHVMKINEF